MTISKFERLGASRGLLGQRLARFAAAACFPMAVVSTGCSAADEDAEPGQVPLPAEGVGGTANPPPGPPGMGETPADPTPMPGVPGQPEATGGMTGVPGGMEGDPGVPEGMGGSTSMPDGMGGETGMPDGMGGRPPVAPPEGACKGAGAMFAELTDPSCFDGKFCEPLPDVETDHSGLIAELEGANSTADVVRLSYELLEAAYPFAVKILDSQPGCHEKYSRDFQKYGVFQASIGLAVHECGHGWDFDGDTFKLAEGISVPHPNRDYFHRSELTDDEFHNSIPDAAANDTYFDKDSPTGNQGLQTMFTEWAQYNHDLAQVYLLFNHTGSEFEVELALNFFWAMPRYLLWAKEKHPGDYDAIMADEGLRETTLKLWGQTLLYYDALASDTDWTASEKHTRYIDAVRDQPKLLGVMNELREAEGCDGI